MASIISHGIVAASLRTAFPRTQASRQLLITGVICSIVPDLDVIGFYLGIQYGDLLGHRGLSHSLVFAAFLAFVACGCLPSTIQSVQRRIALSYFFVAAASHGFLDAMTNGGLGVAFFSPMSNVRYFFSWTPIEVSPLHVGSFFSEWGARVLLSEVKWIWVPAAGFALMASLIKKMKRSSASA